MRHAFQLAVVTIHCGAAMPAAAQTYEEPPAGRDAGTNAEAIAKAQQALATAEATLGKNHPAVAASLDNLAVYGLRRALVVAGAQTLVVSLCGR